MEKEVIAELVQELCGLTSPVGSSEIDCKRLHNLKKKKYVLQDLLEDFIHNSNQYIDSPYFSEKQNAKECISVLSEVKISIEECFKGLETNVLDLIKKDSNEG